MRKIKRGIMLELFINRSHVLVDLPKSESIENRITKNKTVFLTSRS